MGKQINFYMLNSDLKYFLEFILSSNGIFIKMDPKSNKFIIIDRLNFKDKVYITKNEFLNSVFYVKINNCWIIDEIKSSVIELIPSNLVDDGLNWGRIWVETKYWNSNNNQNNNISKDKSKELILFYDQLIKWIKKNYIKKNSSYYSKNVLKWIKNGGKIKFNW